MSGRLLNGRYRLDSLIGRGGMAEVWRGEDLRLGRSVAVKLLDRPDPDPDKLARLRREARTVAKLSHPNIVAGYDLDTDDAVTYLVMELIEGGSLASQLANGPLTAGAAVAIASQVCDALAAAHAAGVVHRDIKPANILLTPAGTVKVCDFGIARLAYAEQERLTATGVVIGTSDYMAPEQAAGDPVDPRTDLYALGCVLYAMLTGGPPFSAETPLEVLSQHLHRAPVPVASHQPGLPPVLAELVDQLLAKRPDDRPADAAEVRTRLAAVTGGATAATAPLPAAAGLPVTAATAVAPLGTPMTLPLPAERPAVPWWRRAAMVAAAAVAVGVAAAAIIGLLDSPDADTTPSAITAPTILAPSVAGATPFVVGPVEQAEVVLATIDAQVEVGELAPDLAEDLRELVDEVLAELAEDGPWEAAEEAEELQQELREMFEEGEISETTYLALADPIDVLIDSLPAERLRD